MSEILSSAEIAMRREFTRDRNLVPPMTHPLSRHWTQPDPSRFLIDDTHAVMTQRECSGLADYTQSQPSGCYPGKCWKAKYLPTNFNRVCRKCHSDESLASRMHGDHVEFKCMICGEHWNQPTVYFLCWFSFSTKPDMCSVYHREILIA